MSTLGETEKGLTRAGARRAAAGSAAGPGPRTPVAISSVLSTAAPAPAPALCGGLDKGSVGQSQFSNATWSWLNCGALMTGFGVVFGGGS